MMNSRKKYSHEKVYHLFDCKIVETNFAFSKDLSSTLSKQTVQPTGIVNKHGQAHRLLDGLGRSK